MIPRQFSYHSPDSLGGVIALLSELGDQAKLLAGGHSLLPMMKLRFAAPEHLIDLKRVKELKGIALVGDVIRIGATTTENEIIFSKLLAEKLPLLVEVAGLIADPQVRYRGTIGGDISHGDPGNDHPAVMLALGASFGLAGPGGTRIVPASEFFFGTYMTALNADEVMTHIDIPLPTPGSAGAYAKLKRKTGDFATAAACVVIRLDRGICAAASIALTNLAPTAIKADDAASFLLGKPLDDAAIVGAAERAMAVCEPAPDLRGDEDYKRAMAGQMVERALRLARDRSQA